MPVGWEELSSARVSDRTFLGYAADLSQQRLVLAFLASAFVAVENSLARSCLALAAARLAFFRADFEGGSLNFPERAMFSMFILIIVFS